MNTETMTITKALSELKLLSKRIDSEIPNSKFCTVNRHSLRNVNGKPIETAKKEMQGSYDTIVSLIARNNAIKKAVTKANALTEITVNGEKMTIAEAIYYKKTGIDYEKELLTTLSIQYDQAVNVLNRENGEKLSKSCEEYLTKMFGTKEVRTDPNEIKQVQDEYMTGNTVDLIEGIDVKKAIETLKNKIDAFEAEIDAQITIANSTTTITIEY